MGTYFFFFFSCVFCLSYPLHAMQETASFYRPTMFFGEPRLQKSLLGTFEVLFSQSIAKQYYNKEEEEGCLLFLYQCLGKTKETKEICGSFFLSELLLSVTQNLFHGFFVHASFPWQSFLFSRYCTHNCCTNDCCTNDYCYDDNYYGNERRSGGGRPLCAVGWTLNYQDTDRLDFFDVSVWGGVTFSSLLWNKRPQEFFIAHAPFLQEKKRGYFLGTHASFGLFDWVTIGAFMKATMFPNNVFHYKPQSSFCTLPHNTSVLHRNGVFFKADHFVRGLSLLLGYSAITYWNDRSDLFCTGTPCTNTHRIGTHNEWSMSTIHCTIEYDFAHREFFIAPRLAFFFDKVLRGKNVYKAMRFSGVVGAEISFHF